MLAKILRLVDSVLRCPAGPPRCPSCARRGVADALSRGPGGRLRPSSGSVGVGLGGVAGGVGLGEGSVWLADPETAQVPSSQACSRLLSGDSSLHYSYLRRLPAPLAYYSLPPPTPPCPPARSLFPSLYTISVDRQRALFGITSNTLLRSSQSSSGPASGASDGCGPGPQLLVPARSRRMRRRPARLNSD